MGRLTGWTARAAVEGRLDRGRRIAASGRTCDARITLDGRRLSPLPRDPDARCTGLVDLRLAGGQVLATVATTEKRFAFDHEVVHVLDRGRWRAVTSVYNGSDGSVGIAAGPAVLGDALVVGWNDENGRAWRLERYALPSGRMTVADPIGDQDVCDIAATDRAIYALANPRCAIDPRGDGGAVIRRVVDPRWRPAPPDE